VAKRNLIFIQANRPVEDLKVMEDFTSEEDLKALTKEFPMLPDHTQMFEIFLNINVE
jgi:hypothetical protein